MQKDLYQVAFLDISKVAFHRVGVTLCLHFVKQDDVLIFLPLRQPLEEYIILIQY